MTYFFSTNIIRDIRDKYEVWGSYGPGAAIGCLIDPETAENKAPPCLARLDTPDCRVDIWRDQCDRRSRKFFCQLRKFLEK